MGFALTDVGSVWEHQCPSLFPLHPWMNGGLEASATGWLAVCGTACLTSVGSSCRCGRAGWRRPRWLLRSQQHIYKKKVSTRRSTCSQALEDTLGNPEMWRWLKFAAFLPILVTTAFLFLTSVFPNPHSLFSFFSLLRCCSTARVSIMTANWLKCHISIAFVKSH